MRASSRQPPATTDPPGKPPAKSLPCKGLRSRAPPAAEKARRSRCSGRRAQACFSARSAMWAPQTGRWMRRKAQTEGGIAALPRRYPANPGSALPRVRRGRCLHRPANPAMPQGPERYWQDKAPHPSVGWRRQLPLQGSLLGENRLQSLPCKGRCPQRGRRGALPPCLAGILQNPAGPCPASVGDDACIVPQTQRCCKPQAAGENARPTKPLQAGSNTKSGSPLPRPAGGPMKSSAPTQGCAFQRKQFAGQP